MVSNNPVQSCLGNSVSRNLHIANLNPYNTGQQDNHLFKKSYSKALLVKVMCYDWSSHKITLTLTFMLTLTFILTLLLGRFQMNFWIYIRIRDTQLVTCL